MKPIAFKGQNAVFGANQPQYQPLPAMRLPDGEVITCWQLTDDERDQVMLNGCIYISQLTFNQPYQPIFPMVDLGDNISIQ